LRLNDEVGVDVYVEFGMLEVGKVGHGARGWGVEAVVPSIAHMPIGIWRAISKILAADSWYLTFGSSDKGPWTMLANTSRRVVVAGAAVTNPA
jgi:hypothetical protein